MIMTWPEFYDLLTHFDERADIEMVERLSRAFERALDQWFVDHPDAPHWNSDPYWNQLEIAI